MRARLLPIVILATVTGCGYGVALSGDEVATLEPYPDLDLSPLPADDPEVPPDPGPDPVDPEAPPDPDGPVEPEVPPEPEVPADPESPFPDVAGHPAEAEILCLLERGIVVGFPDGTFRPDAAGTRAHFAAMLSLAFLGDEEATAPEFPDVPRDHWAASNIGRVAEAGLMVGYPDGSFRPDQPILREEALVSMALALELAAGDTGNLSLFADGAEVSDWARQEVSDSFRAGVLSNDALLERSAGRVYLRPRLAATRGALASFIYYALTGREPAP